RRAGVVHKDVTPRNVMIDREGMVRVIDFGIAAPVAGAEAVAGPRGPVFGSPGHMPPEQLRGEPLTAAADVFAVGALLVEAWTGKAPFRRDPPAESARALEGPRPDLAALVPELAPVAELVTRALSCGVAERP